jgi:hypothetical protein
MISRDSMNANNLAGFHAGKALSFSIERKKRKGETQKGGPKHGE